MVRAVDERDAHGRACERSRGPQAAEAAAEDQHVRCARISDVVLIRCIVADRTSNGISALLWQDSRMASRSKPQPRLTRSTHRRRVHPHIRAGTGGWTYAPWRNNFYPDRSRAAARARIREPPSDRDRSQRHVLRRAEAGELCRVARADAGWFRVFAEGAALRDGAQRARGRRQDDQRLRVRRPCRAGRSARSDQLAIAGNKAIRTRRSRGVLRSAAARTRRASGCDMCSKCANASFACAPTSSSLASIRSRPCSPIRRNIRPFADVTGDFVYARLHAERISRSRPATRRGAGCVGGRARANGRTAAIRRSAAGRSAGGRFR